MKLTTQRNLLVALALVLLSSAVAMAQCAPQTVTVKASPELLEAVADVCGEAKTVELQLTPEVLAAIAAAAQCPPPVISLDCCEAEHQCSQPCEELEGELLPPDPAGAPGEPTARDRSEADTWGLGFLARDGGGLVHASWRPGARWPWFTVARGKAEGGMVEATECSYDSWHHHPRLRSWCQPSTVQLQAATDRYWLLGAAWTW